MKKSVNGLKRPLAMALAAALMVTAVPADVALAAEPSQLEAVESADEASTSEETTLSEDVEASEEDAAEAEEAAAPEEVTESPEEVTEEEVTEPTEEAKDPEEETTEPTEEVKDPEEETTEPTEEVKDPEEETTEPTEEVKDPEEETTEPAEEVTDPEVEAVEPTEDVTVVETEVVTEKAAMSAVKPARPTLTINERNGQLRWTPVEGAWKYEISVTDGTYTYYDEIIDVSKEGETEKLEPQYYSVFDEDNKDSVTENISNLRWLKAKDLNKNEFVYNSDKGGYVYPNDPETTYTYSVRAVNRIVTKDPTTGENVYGDYVNGEWSNKISYQKPGTVVQITDLKYNGCDKDLLGNEKAYVVSFSANITNGGVYAEVSKDNKFANESYAESLPWSDYIYAEKGKYYLPEYVMNRYAGSTVYVRVYNRDGDNYLKDPAGKPVYSNVISIAVPAEEKPVAPAITKLKLDKEDSSGYIFTFDAVLDAKKNQQYELQYSKDKNFPENGYERISNNDRIYYSQIDADTTYYVRAVSKVYVDGHYDENDQWVSGEYLYGTPSNTVQIMRKSEVSVISKLALKETTQTGFILGYNGSIAENEKIEVQVSGKKTFPADIDTALVNGRVYSDAKTFTLDYVDDRDTAKKVVIDYDELGKPGTYYVRARVIKTYPSSDDKVDTMEDYAFSKYTNVVTVKMQVADITLSSKDVTSNSVTLVASGDLPSVNASPAGGVTGGYEFQKKVGKSWTKLAKTTDNNYKDSGLEKDVRYSYRARAFWRNNVTGKTYNGEWTYFSVTTWGAILSLRAESASSTSVKLSWNKVSGAEGYEVYRMEGYSQSSTKETRPASSAYTKYQLLKTVGSKTTSYTDKKLTQNEGFTYYVRAYKTVNGKKSYISSNSDSVSLKFGANIVVTSEKQASNGKVTVTWKKVASASGYYVEKQNTKTGKYETYKKITKNTTTKITLPKVKDPEKSETYRIRAYKAAKNGSTKVTEYSGAATVEVRTYLNAPTNVKAVAQKDGSVKISWKKVSGADYYVVYRTTSSSYTYNKDNKKYTNAGGTAINVYKADSASTTGYSLLDAEDVTGTSVVDRSIKKLNARNEEIEQNRTAPQLGYTYYYYVVAVKKGSAEQYVDSEGTYSSAHSKSAKVTVTNTSITTPKSVAVKAAKGKVTVSWKAVKNAEGYEVLRSTKKNGTYEVVGTVSKGTTKKYVDKTAKAGTKYFYKVRAVKANEAGADSYSADSSAKSVKAK